MAHNMPYLLHNHICRTKGLVNRESRPILVVGLWFWVWVWSEPHHMPGAVRGRDGQNKLLMIDLLTDHTAGCLFCPHVFHLQTSKLKTSLTFKKPVQP